MSLFTGNEFISYRASSPHKRRLKKVDEKPLPAIDDFRLENILEGLNDDVQQLKDAVQLVSYNYRKDLSVEIKQTVRFENQIQNKNVKLSKLIDKSQQLLSSRIKKLSSTKLDSLESELDALLELTESSSSLISNISDKLGKIELGLPKHDRLTCIDSPHSLHYPNIHRIINRKELTELESSDCLKSADFDEYPFLDHGLDETEVMESGDEYDNEISSSPSMEVCDPATERNDRNDQLIASKNSPYPSSDSFHGSEELRELTSHHPKSHSSETDLVHPTSELNSNMDKAEKINHMGCNSVNIEGRGSMSIGHTSRDSVNSLRKSVERELTQNLGIIDKDHFLQLNKAKFDNNIKENNDADTDIDETISEETNTNGNTSENFELELDSTISRYRLSQEEQLLGDDLTLTSIKKKSSNPFLRISAKSTPTVESNYNIIHFKKLRIQNKPTNIIFSDFPHRADQSYLLESDENNASGILSEDDHQLDASIDEDDDYSTSSDEASSAPVEVPIKYARYTNLDQNINPGIMRYSPNHGSIKQPTSILKNSPRKVSPQQQQFRPKSNLQVVATVDVSSNSYSSSSSSPGNESVSHIIEQPVDLFPPSSHNIDSASVSSFPLTPTFKKMPSIHDMSSHIEVSDATVQAEFSGSKSSGSFDSVSRLKGLLN